MSVLERAEAAWNRDAARHPFKVTCNERNCYYCVASQTYEEGVALYTNHSCPYQGGLTTIGWTVSLTTLEKAWISLDATMTELMEGNYDPIEVDLPDTDYFEHPERTRLRGVCRGMAEVLALFMSPHFRTADEIAAEAKRRYKAKKAGEEYETPGLAHLRFMPPPGTLSPQSVRPAQTKPVVKPESKFKPEEVKAIVAALDMGMMTEAELAKMYKVDAAVITRVYTAAKA